MGGADEVGPPRRRRDPHRRFRALQSAALVFFSGKFFGVRSFGGAGAIDRAVARGRRAIGVRFAKGAGGSVTGNFDLAADLPQNADDALVGKAKSGQPLHLRQPEILRFGRRESPQVENLVADRAAAVLDEQIHDILGGHRRKLGVRAAFEALGRLARQLVAAGRPRDGDRVEMRGLD